MCANDDDYLSENVEIKAGTFSVGARFRNIKEKNRIYLKYNLQPITASCYHSYKKVSQKPTCTQEGYELQKCRFCGEIKDKSRKTLPAPGHTFERDDDQCREADCTHSGEVKEICEVCGKIRTTTSSPLGHKYEYDEELSAAATCEKAGYRQYSCARDDCGAYFRIPIPKLGHDYSVLEIEEPATDEDEGFYYYRCSHDECESRSNIVTIFPYKNIKFSAASFTYDGTRKCPQVQVKDIRGAVISPANYTLQYYNNVNAGTATAHVTFTGKYYKGTLSAAFKIEPAKQNITVKNGSASYKKSAVAKKARTFSIGAAAKTKLTYKSSNKKYVTVTSGGKVTVKKGAPKGTYKITVSAVKTKNYKAATKTVTIKVS